MSRLWVQSLSRVTLPFYIESHLLWISGRNIKEKTSLIWHFLKHGEWNEKNPLLKRFTIHNKHLKKNEGYNGANNNQDGDNKINSNSINILGEYSLIYSKNCYRKKLTDIIRINVTSLNFLNLNSLIFFFF